jgi:hypothetical protein
MQLIIDFEPGPETRKLEPAQAAQVAGGGGTGEADARASWNWGDFEKKKGTSALSWCVSIPPSEALQTA